LRVGERHQGWPGIPGRDGHRADADATGFFIHRVSIQRDVTAHKRNEASPGRPVPRLAAFDVVVTDLNMPELCGLQLAEAAAGIRADLPVVLGSGFVGDELTGIAASAGIAAMFRKEEATERASSMLQDVLAAPFGPMAR